MAIYTLTTSTDIARKNRWCSLALGGLLVSMTLAAPPAQADVESASRRLPVSRSSAQPDVEPFRLRVQREMTAALGRPVETRQDAINAAYLRAGWSWNAPIGKALDNAAHLQAWAWGFRIAEFTRTRREAFMLDSLANGPLGPDAPKELTQAEPAPERARSGA